MRLLFSGHCLDGQRRGLAIQTLRLDNYETGKDSDGNKLATVRDTPFTQNTPLIRLVALISGLGILCPDEMTNL